MKWIRRVVEVIEKTKNNKKHNIGEKRSRRRRRIRRNGKGMED